MSEHFTYQKLLRYSLPSIGNMLVLTSFQVVDGFFVSNLLGVTQLESVNLIYPIFMVLHGCGADTFRHIRRSKPVMKAVQSMLKDKE